MHLGKVTILHISLRSIAEYFAKNSLRSFGKIFCKQFASLIWQKESLYRANFATFASLNICKIILNVRSAHYLQINLCTLAMLAHKLGPSLGFFGCLTLFYFGLLQQVGGRYTYFEVTIIMCSRSSNKMQKFKVTKKDVFQGKIAKPNSILMPLITIHYYHTTKIYLTFIHALHSITYSRRVVTDRRVW